MILIGSGPSVLNKKQGKIIDEYDIVVRINHAKTRGYEEYVGSKTDIWTISGHLLVDYVKKKRRIKELEEKEVWVFNTHRKFGGTVAMENITKVAERTLSNYYLGSMEYARKVHEISGSDPSTGIMLIAYVLDILPEYKEKNFKEYFPISITGFDCFETEEDYWGPFHKNLDRTIHDGECEREFIEKYIRKGKLQKI